MIGSISSDIQYAKHEGLGEDHPTCTNVEDAQGDREDIQQIHSDSEGHLGDEEAGSLGRAVLLSTLEDQSGPCRQEQNSLAEAAWEDSEDILEVPRTPVSHGCLETRAFLLATMACVYTLQT